jgi:hypothetical protein
MFRVTQSSSPKKLEVEAKRLEPVTIDPSTETNEPNNACARTETLLPTFNEARTEAAEPQTDRSRIDIEVAKRTSRATDTLEPAKISLRIDAGPLSFNPDPTEQVPNPTKSARTERFDPTRTFSFAESSFP